MTRQMWSFSVITLTFVVGCLVLSQIGDGAQVGPQSPLPEPTPLHTNHFVHAKAHAPVLVDGPPRNGQVSLRPGDRINRETLDTRAQIKALLTPSTWWMVERGMTIDIVASKAVRWPKAYRTATDAYHRDVRLSADGRRLINYRAGCPFPTIDINDPLAGFQVMWNTEQPPYSIDNRGASLTAQLINRAGQVERTYSLPWRQLMWAGRLYQEPKPTIPHSPPYRHTSLFGPYLLPHDLAGMLFLNLRYLEPDRPDDTYVYFPEARRVRRVGVNGRGGQLGTVLGTDFDVDSFWGFSAQIAQWSFRVLAEKDILAIVHGQPSGASSTQPSVWCAPRDGRHGILAALPCMTWEKRRVWVVEATPSEYSGPYAYSKRVLYVDREFFFPLIAESYDRRGELWKTIVHGVSYTTKPYPGFVTQAAETGQPADGADDADDADDEWLFIPNWVLIDLQQVRATAVEAPAETQQPIDGPDDWYFNENVRTNSPDVYTPDALMRMG